MRWFTANIGVHHVHRLCSRNGPRFNARSKGPDQKEVDALITSFGNG
jgi:hypothetical protein